MCQRGARAGGSCRRRQHVSRECGDGETSLAEVTLTNVKVARLKRRSRTVIVVTPYGCRVAGEREALRSRGATFDRQLAHRRKMHLVSQRWHRTSIPCFIGVVQRDLVVDAVYTVLSLGVWGRSG